MWKPIPFPSGLGDGRNRVTGGAECRVATVAFRRAGTTIADQQLNCNHAFFIDIRYLIRRGDRPEMAGVIQIYIAVVGKSSAWSHSLAYS